MKRYSLLITLFVLALLLVACGGGQENETETDTQPEQVVETVVVVATPTAVPEEAAAVSQDSSSEETAASADAPVLEPAPVQAGQPTMTTLTDLNVRSGPGTNYTIVGVLRAGQSASVIGKSSNGGWWKITCPTGVGGECWASAGSQYSTASNVENVPAAAAPPPPATQVAAAPTTSEATAEPTGTVETAVSPTATATAAATTTTTTNPTSPPPTATQSGNNNPPPTSTPTSPPPTATQTGNNNPPPTSTSTPTSTPTATATVEQIQIAPFDNDSLQNPAVSVFLSPTGSRNFSHTNDISFENGDQDDWIEFEFPNNSNANQAVWITLNCTISGSDSAQVRATIYENGVQTTQIVLCNEGEKQLTVDNTKTQQVRIHFGIPAPNTYATYTITVVGFR